MKYIDLTRTITSELPCWPNDLFKLEQIVHYGFVIDNILHTAMHIGTHIDVAQHMIEGGKSLCQYPPEKFIGRGVLLDARNRESVDVDLLANADVRSGDIVLVLTGSEAHYGTPAYFDRYPIFTEAFGHKLVELGVKMVGMDSPSPDYYPFPVHKIVLAHDVLIIEMMTHLEKLIGIPDFEVIALPPKFDTAGAFVRAIAVVK